MQGTVAPAADGGPASAWRVVGASVAGTGHVRSGLPCQDAHAFRVLPDGTLVAAVADGAGSAARAAEAAAAAVAHAVAAIADALGAAVAVADPARNRGHGIGGIGSDLGIPPDTGGVRETGHGGDMAADGYRLALDTGFRAARAALEDLAVATWEPLRAFACTLTCAVAGPDALGVAQIGDGIAVARRDGGDLFAASRPQKGEYANEAHFLTRADALARVEHTVASGRADAVGLTTDGLLRLALRWPELAPHAPFWTPLLAFAARAGDPTWAGAQLAGFLGSPRVAARTDDDTTLVLAVRGGSGTAGGP